MAQSGYGKVSIFEDFLAGEDIVAATAASRSFGGSGLRVIGQGIAENDSGITVGESDGLNGVGILTTTNEDAHSCGLTTGKVFDVGKMAPINIECRVQFPDLDTKAFYFGLTDVNDDTTILEGNNLVASGASLTLSASDLCGFLIDAEATDDEDWIMVYNGGTTSGETTIANIDADNDAVAGEWDVLRLEVSINGTARWYVNGVLKQTVEGAVSTSTDLAVLAMIEARSAAIEYAWIDYIAIEANRDWTE
jgi:hypothetical protein|tara:strand:- start:406 stop:1155 length:750 start_codon:yes stop_codon:yes gene_type:complete